MKRTIAIAATIIASASAMALEKENSRFGTAGPAGTEVVTDTTSAHVYTSESGVKVGGFSSTTVTGGSSTDGSGNAIPDGSSGSKSNTSYGVQVTIPTE